MVDGCGPRGDKPFAAKLLEGTGGEPVADVLELVMDSKVAWWP